jgi:hypothetical protein
VSFMRLGFPGRVKRKLAPRRGVVSSPQAAAMRFDDGAADAKADAIVVRFGRKKRIENLVRLLRGKPNTGIADRHLKLLVFRWLRRDVQKWLAPVG